MEEQNGTLKQKVRSSDLATTAETTIISSMPTECDEVSLHLCPEDAMMETIPPPRPREEVQSRDDLRKPRDDDDDDDDEEEKDVTGIRSPTANVHPEVYKYYLEEVRSSELDEEDEDEKPPFGASTVAPSSATDSVPFVSGSHASFLPPYGVDINFKSYCRERSPVSHGHTHPYEFIRTGTNLCPKVFLEGSTDQQAARGFDTNFLGTASYSKRRPTSRSASYSVSTANHQSDVPSPPRPTAPSPPPVRRGSSNRNYRRRQQRRRNKEAAAAPPPPGVRYCDPDVHRRIVEKYSTTVCSDACSRGGVRKLDYDRNPWNLDCAIDYKTREICDRLDLEERVYNFYVRNFVFNPVTTPNQLLKYMGKFSERKNELPIDVRIDKNRKKLKSFQDLAPLSVFQEILIVNAPRIKAECYAQDNM